MELEQDLSLKQQFVDVVIIRQDKTKSRSAAELPDGLDNLAKYNLLTYKSMCESLDDWALGELLSHYVSYRKLISQARLKPAKDFRLYAVTTRFPRKLLKRLIKVEEIMPGVYDVHSDAKLIRVLALKEMPVQQQNAIWQLFSAKPAQVVWGAAHYQWRSELFSSIMNELYQTYEIEGVTLMSYTVNDFIRDSFRNNLADLSPEEIAQLLSANRPEVAEQLTTQALQQGVEQGIEKVGLEMLKKDLDVKFIQETTGLSDAQIQALMHRLHRNT